MKSSPKYSIPKEFKYIKNPSSFSLYPDLISPPTPPITPIAPPPYKTFSISSKLNGFFRPIPTPIRDSPAMVPPNQSSVHSGKAQGIPPVPKALHYVIILSLIPAIAFGVPAIVRNRNAGAILGIILVGLDGILSFYRSNLLHFKGATRPSWVGQDHQYQALLPEHESYERLNAGRMKASILALCDLGLGLGLLAAILMSLLIEFKHAGSYWYHNDVGSGVIIAYATVPFIVDALIHAFFFFYFIAYNFIINPKKPALCSRCRDPICSPHPEDATDSSRPSMECTV